ncbi:MAG: hypothetical protein QOH06_2465, partial [Acidobacteriota bacterium]|nr:hypothetical protein [Acidobacteriota bacterium]
MEPTDHPRPDSPKAGRARNSDLSKILLERRRKDRPSNRIPRRAPGALTPLSYAQEQIWFLEQLAPDGAAYHIARSFALEGPLDPAALARSLGAVVARHEALRTSFAIVEGQPVQAVAAELALAIPVLDLRAVPAPAREEEARRLEREEVLRPFDLARGPVLRLTLLRLADERSVLLLTLHHIAADGWSLGILLRELGALYAGETLPPLPLQYADFALWQRERLAGSVLEKLLAFWRTQLEGAPPVLALPTDRPRPAIQSFRGAGVRRVLRRELAARLRSFGERERASPFMALLAAFQALLVRHTGQEDLVVGSPVSGRSRSELEGLIGLFINMLVLRTSLASDPGFRELTGRVRAVTLSAYEHQEMPFEKLVTELSPERDLGHAPVFQVIFTLQSAAWERLDLPGIELAPREIKREETKVDLTFAIHETGDGLALALQYDRDLFDGTTMARLAAQYEELLSAALAEPDRPVSGLPALLPAERHQVFHEWNDTGAAYPYDRALPAVFAEQVERSPAEVALICGDVCLTFRELGEQSDRLAHHLQLLGVGPEDLVALCLERSPDLIVGLLGILKAGAAYVPLDPESPSERLAWILADTGARLLVTEERLSGLLPDPSVRRVLLDGDRALIAQRGADPLPNLSGPESLAYVMYTSGSSGRPKGVAVPHRAVARLVRGPSYATFAPGEVFLQLAPVSFDASTFEIWGSLLNGARLVVFPPRKPTLAELEEEIARHGVSTLWLTAGLFHVMLDERPQAFARVRQMLAGGDVLSPIQSRKFLAVALPGARLINGYGPTEGTTFTCCNPVSDSAAVHSSFPIGRPIANTRVYLLDGTMTAVPLCVAGELFIGGDGLARGYWNRPDLTAEKFVPDPFGGQPGARLYRSGDLARWLPDGTVDFLGRIDQQVKIRGFRVEPGEIEASLLAEPEVREAAVVVRQEAGDRRLVAYIVGTNADLKERLRARLPEYMVPAAIVALEALPLLPSGKVDRGALAKLGVLWAAAPEQGHVAPRTALEGELAGMWSSSLGLEKVGIHDNFFELGGNSITGAVLINRLQERLGETVHVAAIFDEPTIAGLAAWLGSRSPEAVERIWGIAPAQWDGASPPPAIPLSFAQERLWFLDQLEPGNPFYNIPAALRLEGALDAAALQRSFDQAVRRHRVLRTRFALVEGAPVQVAAPDLRVPLPVVDLGALPRALREAETQRLANAEARRPFDLSQGPLIRTTLLRQESEAHALLLSMHHIVSDGWSLGVLLQELAALYESSPLPELPIQYADYAVWQRGRLAGEALEAELAWWRERLAGVPALLELPTDRPRPPVQSFRGGKVEIALPAALSERLAALSRKSGATLFMALLAGFDALLSRLTGQLDVVVGSPVAGRNRAELEGLIGFFVNTLVLRTDLSGDPGFAQVLERIRQTTVGAYAHQEVPFEKLVAELAPVRTLAHAPLFQVMLILQNAPWRDLRLGDLALTWLGVEAGTSKFDLRLSLMEGEEGLAGSIVYNRDLFDNSTVTRFAAGFHRLLAGALADPGAPLPELPLLDEAERHQLLREWNDTGAAFRRNTCLHELIARQAARTPDAPALVFEGESLTYAEVDRRANHLAWRLRELGVGPEVRVAVAVERSLELPLALLAVLKAGGAYVPLDPSYPQERLAYMLEDSRAAVQLTRERVLELSGESDEAPDSGVRTENLAYVIYTSGSTGRPKGAMNSHRGIVNRLRWMQSAYGLDSSDRVLQKTPASFDVSVWEFFWPLLTGACLVLAKPGGHQDSAYLVDLIQRERVTTMHFVPSMLQVFVEQRGVEECTSLKRVICSGEALPMDLVRRYFERMGAELHNLYGPTEAAVDVTYWACRRDDRTVPIGRPIANLSIQIVDRSLHLVPLGVPGELLIGGAGVGRGYLDRPDLTAERFVPGEGERLYRTGDLARFLGDGRIEYLGRIDHQVKVRGFRIELQEIEAALMAEPEVREAAVVVREEASDRRLVAYVVSTVGTDADLKERLRARLPDYMVPAAIVALEALPLSPSGKVDRGALAKLGVLWTAAPEQGYVAPRTALESELAGMWSTSLGLDKIGVHDNFFELGGNSITGAILINRLQERLGEIVHVVAIFDAPTVAGLAAWLSSHCPEAVERLWGPGSLRGEAVGEAHRLVLGPAAAAAFRKLIEPLAPAVFSGKSPRAVFLLSPPRSGSTLLRVMLAGHPSLFAPPELELLSFNTMAERRAAFSGRDSFWLEGAIRAVMEIQGEGPKKAREWIDRSERNGWTTHRFYREIQELLGGRMLVDKTPSYALDPSVLQRAEEGFDGPLYIHLLRHPYGMISSFEEAKLDQVFFRRAHPFGRRELAELVWRVSHENVTAFLAGIPAERHRAVYFEDLVREPEVTLRALCGFLGLDFDPAMAAPYQDKGRRMTDGLYAESRMLGDVKFHQHQGVEASTAERWRERYREDFLAPETWVVAAAFGYERPAHGLQPIAPAEWDGASPLPLSFAQERLWFLDQLEPDSSFYNIPAMVRLQGVLHAAALQEAFNAIVRRHRTLRTRFAAVQGEPAQVVEPELCRPLPVVDLADLPAVLRETETRHLANAEARRPFDLSQVPLLRTMLLRLGKEEHALLLCMHHIVSDGWSMGLLFQELASLYEGSPLPELPIQFADFAVWQRGRLAGEALEQELAWWRERLAGAPGLLELPTDRPRPAVQSFRGGRVELALPRSSEIAALSRRSGTTLFMTLLAAFDALLSRLTGQLDVVVGSPITGRNRTELEGLIGFFVNTLVLRTDLSGDPGFDGILERVRQATIGAYIHQELPFEKLVGELAPVRTLAHAPLFQVMLVLQNLPRRELRIGGALGSVMPAEERTAKFDLTLGLVERGAGLAGAFQFNSDLFDAATITRFADHFRTLVEGAVANPAVRLSELPLLSAAARAQLLREWNDTAVSIASIASIAGIRSLPEQIAQQAARTPEAVAVLCGDASLTYAALDRRANWLAWHLQSLGVGPETRVAIAMERSPDLLVALLGVLKAGGAYVPIDPSYPEERRAYML